MIFYFSGTGNSQWIAEQLSSILGEKLIAIADAMADKQFTFSLSENEMLGFVFPTYSWGPAPVMIDFVKQLNIHGYTSDTYCYMVTSCGDDIGLSVDLWKKALSPIACNAAFSVQMPNNYILLPGFDVDSKELECEKKLKARNRIDFIIKNITQRTAITDVTEGRFAWLKTRVIYPLFSRYSMSDKKFTTNTEKCNRCGLCVKNCPTKNICMSPKSAPQWNGNCAMCLACIHRCPMHAIEYGKATQKKGRYFFK